jgi:hypothetical protein
LKMPRNVSDLQRGIINFAWGIVNVQWGTNNFGEGSFNLHQGTQNSGEGTNNFHWGTKNSGEGSPDVLGHGSKEGLVENPQQWPGVHAIRPLPRRHAGPRDLVRHWVPRWGHHSRSDRVTFRRRHLVGGSSRASCGEAEMPVDAHLSAEGDSSFTSLGTLTQTNATVRAPSVAEINAARC